MTFLKYIRLHSYQGCYWYYIKNDLFNSYQNLYIIDPSTNHIQDNRSNTLYGILEFQKFLLHAPDKFKTFDDLSEDEIYVSTLF